MKKILTFLLILSTMIFIGCKNDVTNSNTTNQGGSGNQGNINTPDGLSSSHDGTWYFYSEDGSVKGDTVTVANGGIKGLKTSSGTAIDFEKNNISSKVFDINNPDSQNYVVYKDGNTGGMNFTTEVAYVRIKDASGTIILEGMLSKTQQNTTIDANYAGTYTATKTSGLKIEITVKSTLVTLKTTSASKTRNYQIPAAYFTKSGNTYTSIAINYPETVLNFDSTTFTIKHKNINYSADANFNISSSSASALPISSSTDKYTKGQ